MFKKTTTLTNLACLCLCLITCPKSFGDEHGSLTRSASNIHTNDADDATDQEQIAQLVKQLNSKSYQHREQATDQLINIGPPAMQLVAEAMLERHPEQVFRCAHILETIGVTGDEGTQLKIVRLFYLLSDLGYPQLIDSTSDFRKKWKEKRRQHVISQLRNAGVTVSSTGNIDFIGGGFIGEGGIEIGDAGIPTRELWDHVNSVEDGQSDASDDSDKSDAIEKASKRQSNITPNLYPASDLPPMVTPESMISAILQASNIADFAAIERIENRKSTASTKPNPAVSKHREILDDVLEARAGVGGIRIIRPGEMTLGSVARGHQIEIDENSDLEQLARWLPQLEYVVSFVATDATITPRLVSLIEKRQELRTVSFSQCDFDSKLVHALSKKRPDMTVTVVGKALLGVYGPTDSTRNRNGSTCVISEVVPDTAAAEAGIEVGDAILKVEDFEIETFQDLIVELAARDPGDEVDITLNRSGKEKTVTVKLRPR